MPIQMVVPTRDSFCGSTIQFPTAVSDEELMQIGRENPGMTVERIGCDQVVMSPSGTESGGQAARVFAQIARWAEDLDRGEYFGPDTGFRLPDESVLSPDAAWVSGERIALVAGPDREGYWPLCPDLVVEVASESDSRTQLHAKCERWIVYGATVAVLVDPLRRRTELFEQTGERTETSSLTVEIPRFPGLVLNLKRVWQGIRGT